MTGLTGFIDRLRHHPVIMSQFFTWEKPRVPCCSLALSSSHQSARPRGALLSGYLSFQLRVISTSGRSIRQHIRWNPYNPCLYISNQPEGIVVHNWSMGQKYVSVGGEDLPSALQLALYQNTPARMPGWT
ncbi:hypothetical protein F5887DRAFT_1162331 [Amanita rubescens]|nr:hypothetical protein F5887DRAFT_1162331 [Amanita rubescens]